MIRFQYTLAKKKCWPMNLRIIKVQITSKHPLSMISRNGEAKFANNKSPNHKAVNVIHFIFA